MKLANWNLYLSYPLKTISIKFFNLLEHLWSQNNDSSTDFCPELPDEQGIADVYFAFQKTPQKEVSGIKSWRSLNLSYFWHQIFEMWSCWNQ